MQNIAWIGAWGISTTTAGAVFGMAWAGQDVTLPLYALLALTFVPTKGFIEAGQTALDSFKKRIEPAE